MDERERQIAVRVLIQARLKDILRTAKKQQRYCAVDYISQLYGMINYMSIVGDITEDTRVRINKLVTIIERKYYV